MSTLPPQLPWVWIKAAITALENAALLAKSPGELDEIQLSLQNLRNLLRLLKEP